jgi:hypothetical protein
MNQLEKSRQNMKKLLLFLGVFPTLLFGQTVTGLYDAHNQLVDGLPYGMQKTVDIHPPKTGISVHFF